MKRRLETIIEYQTKGAILRSKSRWYNGGEKNSKYFLNLEKRHCKQGTIAQLKIDDNDFVSTQKEILKECESFYQNLSSSKVNGKENRDDFFPAQKNQKSLNKDEQLLPGSITLDGSRKNARNGWSSLRILQNFLERRGGNFDKRSKLLL